MLRVTKLSEIHCRSALKDTINAIPQAMFVPRCYRHSCQQELSNDKLSMQSSGSLDAFEDVDHVAGRDTQRIQPADDLRQ